VTFLQSLAPFDAALLGAVVNDPRFGFAVAAAMLAGLVRGFSGFGSALVYVPLVAAIYEPKLASGTLLLINFVTGLPFAIPAARQCDWRDVTPVFVGAAVAAPLGTAILLVADIIVLRWAIVVLVFSLLVVLASGWRYRMKPVLPVKLGVGAVAGVLGGIAQVSGPPVIIYWFGSMSRAVTVRANLLIFFTLSGAVICATYFVQGVFVPESYALAVLLGLPFLLAMSAGAWLFRTASDIAYRRIGYVIVAFAALVSMPVFDGVLH
jgi:hypothetical protein